MAPSTSLVTTNGGLFNWPPFARRKVLDVVAHLLSHVAGPEPSPTAITGPSPVTIATEVPISIRDVIDCLDSILQKGNEPGNFQPDNLP